MYSDTLAVLELCSRISTERRMNLIDPEAIFQHFDMMETLQKKLQTSTQDNQQLSELNNRLKRQIGNYEQALKDSNATIHQLMSDLAAANAKNDCLTDELDEHRRIFGMAKDQLKNVPIRKSTLQLQENDDEVFLSGDRTMQQNLYNSQHNKCEKPRPKRRSNSHHHNASSKRTRLAFNEQISPYRTPRTTVNNGRQHLSTVRDDNDENRERAKLLRRLAAAQHNGQTPLSASCANGGSRLPIRLGRRRAVPATGHPPMMAAPSLQPPPSLPTMGRRRSVSESGLFPNGKMPSTLTAGAVCGKQVTTPTSRRCFGSRIPQSSGRKMAGFGPAGWNRGRPINSCVHQFVLAFGKRSQHCKMCENKLGIYFQRCKDCKLCVHSDCRSFAPLPCAPFVVPPAKFGAQKLRLADFCPSTSPKVPAQLIRCVYAIESVQKNGVEVYEHAEPIWSDTYIFALFDDFEKLRSATVLNGKNARTLTGFVKWFLQELMEPLIPITSYNEFVHAAQLNDQRLLRGAIDGLFPLPSRDTLAYLCLHWQQLIKRAHTADYANASQCDQDGITRRLALALAPTVCSTMPKDSEHLIRKAQKDNVQLPPEEQEKVMIMEKLLNFDNWSQILAQCCTSEQPQKIAVPAEMPAKASQQLARKAGTKVVGTTMAQSSEFSADSSMLGPVTWTPSTPHALQEQRSNIISRLSRTGPLFERPY